MAWDRPLPPPIREIVEGHGLEIWELPLVSWPDEYVLRRRAIFGDAALFASVIAERDGRIALVRDAEKVSVGGWTIPGGTVEPGESLVEAAVREAKEESGLDVVVTGPLAVGATSHVAPSAGRVDDYDVIFEANVIGGALAPGDPKEIVEARWFSPDEVEEILERYGFENAHPFDHSLFRAIREFLGGRR